jgi:hypothetical protein
MGLAKAGADRQEKRGLIGNPKFPLGSADQLAARAALSVPLRRLTVAPRSTQDSWGKAARKGD